MERAGRGRARGETYATLRTSLQLPEVVSKQNSQCDHGHLAGARYRFFDFSICGPVLVLLKTLGIYVQQCRENGHPGAPTAQQRSVFAFTMRQTPLTPEMDQPRHGRSSRSDNGFD